MSRVYHARTNFPRALRTVVIDDMSDVRELITLVLNLSDNFQVVGTGTDGYDAISLAERFRPDIMVMDLSMPKMDGLAASKGVLELFPATLVVLLSGFKASELTKRTSLKCLSKDQEISSIPQRLLALWRDSSPYKVKSQYAIPWPRCPDLADSTRSGLAELL